MSTTLDLTWPAVAGVQWGGRGPVLGGVGEDAQAGALGWGILGALCASPFLFVSLNSPVSLSLSHSPLCLCLSVSQPEDQEMGERGQVRRVPCMGSFPVPSACLPPQPPNPQLSPTSAAPQVWGLLPGGPRPRPALGLGGGPLCGGAAGAAEPHTRRGPRPPPEQPHSMGCWSGHSGWPQGGNWQWPAGALVGEV